MKEMYRQEYFLAYLVYKNDVGSVSILKDHLHQEALKDNFEEFVRQRSVDLVMIIDHKSTEALWVCKNHSVKVGDSIDIIHEMWTHLANQPRYFLIGSTKYDNHTGGKPAIDC